MSRQFNEFRESARVWLDVGKMFLNAAGVEVRRALETEPLQVDPAVIEALRPKVVPEYMQILQQLPAEKVAELQEIDKAYEVILRGYDPNLDSFGGNDAVREELKSRLLGTGVEGVTLCNVREFFEKRDKNN